MNISTTTKSLIKLCFFFYVIEFVYYIFILYVCFQHKLFKFEIQYTFLFLFSFFIKLLFLFLIFTLIISLRVFVLIYGKYDNNLYVCFMHIYLHQIGSYIYLFIWIERWDNLFCDNYKPSFIWHRGILNEMKKK